IVLRTFLGGVGIGFPVDFSTGNDPYIGVDSNMNVVAGLMSPEVTKSIAGGAVHGILLNDSGSLIYGVRNNEIDLFDVHHGDERERILLPAANPLGNLSITQTAIDETGGRIFAITKSGLCVVTLDLVPLSIGSVNPSSGASGGGSQVTIRGSGFT